MVRYKLASLAKRPKGASVTLPPISGSVAAETAYLKALRASLREMATQVREMILPIAEREVAAAKRMTVDMTEHDFTTLDIITSRLTASASAMVRRILNLEARRHTDNFMASAKRVLGIDLAAVVRQEDLSDYLEAATARNVGLIKGLLEDTAKRLKGSVLDAVINGRSATVLRKELTEQFALSDRRAKLIARDQISKLNSDLNRIRHVQAGVTSYEWMTSHDERVRPLHRSLDGHEYRYGEATGAEGGLPPGQPINCRCVARGIVKF
ncbi:minor capsid protein [Phyllobacterium sp. BT25]|uniref:Minor capsid protein n=1 Tax=Phyllobacterium pellucidum TaxID=2740464 RepID=A0A849VN75_9HYPH|nr:phage minor head protein [Phyllobacterium pellucidum]NTS31281.1 minor capsid protein [Phyllobacterium pellucidum]